MISSSILDGLWHCLISVYSSTSLGDIIGLQAFHSETTLILLNTDNDYVGNISCISEFSELQDIS